MISANLDASVDIEVVREGISRNFGANRSCYFIMAVQQPSVSVAFSFALRARSLIMEVFNFR